MIPVVLSGGSGTRLWPISRARLPKQFCDLFDESLLTKTLRRVQALGSPWVVTGKDLSVLTQISLRECHIPANQALFEPQPRNTAPAIALLCQYFLLRGWASEVVGVFASDHLVQKEDEFLHAADLAESAARAGLVVTLGIRPSHAATGFGYIETSPQKIMDRGQLGAFAVRGFREKPDASTAQKFILQGNFFWNAGIFFFQVSKMIEHFKNLMPDLWREISALKEDLSNLPEIFAKIQPESLDYGIMEKLKEQVCIPVDLGWSDLGCWDDLADLSEKRGNRLNNHAQVVNSESNNNFVMSAQNKVVALQGVQDLLVVDTPDALLIAKRGESQKIKKIAEGLAGSNPQVVREHRSERRPWGGYEILQDSPDYKVKKIFVDPGQRISYQSHAKRAELWIIVKGQGVVTIDEREIPVKVGENISIPLGAKHRISNTGNQVLEFVEVQSGSYFGEDDIVRYSDDYKRI